ncbi:MAG: rhodanese-like domain-containing protein, partial [Verrucomicrobiota bacterium]
DARDRAKFEKGHQEGAILLNEEEWNAIIYEQFETFATLEKPLVVYCDGSRCEKSKAVADRLTQELGLPEVYFLFGGWKGARR